MVNTDVYDFGLRLKELRKAAKLTQKKVADRLGVTDSVIVRYENNNLLPPVDNLELMAIMYGVSLDYMRNLDSKKRCIYLDDFPAEHHQMIFDMLKVLKKGLNPDGNAAAG